MAESRGEEKKKEMFGEQASEDLEREWRGDFCFVQAADTQLGFMSDPTWGAEGDGESWKEEIELAERLVRCCNALRPRPRFVAVCGDLVHALPEGVLGDSPAVRRYANTSRYSRQNADFKRVMAGLEMPLVCVCGNHDVGDRPTPGSLAAYRELYGPDWRAFWCGGMRSLVLNAQLLSDPSGAPDEAQAQEEWLAAELEAVERDQPKHVVVFQHIPWFLREEQEPREGYFNLPQEARVKWLPRMERARVKTIFCGHYHRNLCSRTRSGALEMVVTSAIGRQMSESEVAKNGPDPQQGGVPGSSSDIRSGFRLVSVHESGLFHEYHEFDALETDLGLSTPGPEADGSAEKPQKRSRVENLVDK